MSDQPARPTPDEPGEEVEAPGGDLPPDNPSDPDDGFSPEHDPNPPVDVPF